MKWSKYIIRRYSSDLAILNLTLWHLAVTWASFILYTLRAYLQWHQLANVLLQHACVYGFVRSCRCCCFCSNMIHVLFTMLLWIVRKIVIHLGDFDLYFVWLSPILNPKFVHHLGCNESKKYGFWCETFDWTQVCFIQICFIYFATFKQCAKEIWAIVGHDRRSRSMCHIVADVGGGGGVRKKNKDAIITMLLGRHPHSHARYHRCNLLFYHEWWFGFGSIKKEEEEEKFGC